MSYDDINREFVEMSDDLGMLDKTPKRDNVIKAPKDVVSVKGETAGRTAGKAKKATIGKTIIKALGKRFTSRQIVADNSVKVNVQRLAQSADIDPQNDRSRFFNNNFRVERRQLFFGN